MIWGHGVFLLAAMFLKRGGGALMGIGRANPAEAWPPVKGWARSAL